jgi:hypothetical protein
MSFSTSSSASSSTNKEQINERFNKLEATNARLEAMLQTLLMQLDSNTATSPNQASSSIQHVQQHNKQDLVLPVISPPQSNFSFLKNAASSLASTAVRTVTPLVSDGPRFLGQVSAEVFSPLPHVVTKRNSTDSSSNTAALPVAPDLDLTISSSTPHLADPLLDNSSSHTSLEGETMQMQQQRSKQAMQQELDAMKLRMVDVLPSLALSSDAAADNESTLSVTKMETKPVVKVFNPTPSLPPVVKPMHNRSSHERAAKISSPRLIPNPRSEQNNDFGNHGLNGYGGHANTSVTNQEIENTQRCDEISTSLFNPFTADPMSNQVRWLSNSIDGPYAGKLE